MRMVDTKEYLDQVVALLREGKTDVPVPVSGTSMCPFLHPEDPVFLNLPPEKIKKGDILLFTRPTGQYVLHRVIGVRPAYLLLLGDNQVAPEQVPRDRVWAIVTSVRRKGKPVERNAPVWWFYAHIWRWLAPLRPWLGKLWRKLKS